MRRSSFPVRTIGRTAPAMLARMENPKSRRERFAKRIEISFEVGGCIEIGIPRNNRVR